MKLFFGVSPAKCRRYTIRMITRQKCGNVGGGDRCRKLSARNIAVKLPRIRACLIWRPTSCSMLRLKSR